MIALVPIMAKMTNALPSSAEIVDKRFIDSGPNARVFSGESFDVIDPDEFNLLLARLAPQTQRFAGSLRTGRQLARGQRALPGDLFA